MEGLRASVSTSSRMLPCRQGLVGVSWAHLNSRLLRVTGVVSLEGPSPGSARVTSSEAPLPVQVWIWVRSSLPRSAHPGAQHCGRHHRHQCLPTERAERRRCAGRLREVPRAQAAGKWKRKSQKQHFSGHAWPRAYRQNLLPQAGRGAWQGVGDSQTTLGRLAPRVTMQYCGFCPGQGSQGQNSRANHGEPRPTRSPCARPGDR